MHPRTRSIAEWNKRHPENWRKKNRNHRQQLREWVQAYLATHSCVDCGEADPIVLEQGERK